MCLCVCMYVCERGRERKIDREREREVWQSLIIMIMVRKTGIDSGK